MKRHPALEPFSRDHNVGLVLARSLTSAADADIQASFASIWQEELENHFDEEERLLGPLVSVPHKSQLQSEHNIIRQAAKRAATNELTTEECHALGNLLDQHIRWEERDLFPAIESSASEATLASLARATDVLERHRSHSTAAPRRHELASKRPHFESPAIDLNFLTGIAQESGPLWGAESEQLDTTLLFWRRGEGISSHVNQEVDVLVVFLSGSARVTVGEKILDVKAGQAVIIPRNSSRAIEALEDCSHLNIHQRRKRLSPGLSSNSFKDREIPKRSGPS